MEAAYAAPARRRRRPARRRPGHDRVHLGPRPPGAPRGRWPCRSPPTPTTSRPSPAAASPAPAVAGPLPRARRRGAWPTAGLVILSNPHNPIGRLPRPGRPARGRRAATRRATLVVDESYVDFLARPGRRHRHRRATHATTSSPCARRRSSTASPPPGPAWRGAADGSGSAACSGPARRGRSRASTPPSPSRRWPRRLGRAVPPPAGRRRPVAGRPPCAGWPLAAVAPPGHAPVHYRCLLTSEPDALAGAFAGHGLGVRPLGRPTASTPGALRILAPLARRAAARWPE